VRAGLMCIDDAGPYSGALKGCSIVVLIWAILHLNLLGIILASVVLCGCCGQVNQIKSCIIIFTSVCLVLETVGLLLSIAYGALWLEAANQCSDSINCVPIQSGTTVTCSTSTYGRRLETDPVKMDLLELDPPEAAPFEMDDVAGRTTATFDTLVELAPRLLYPIATYLLRGSSVNLPNGADAAGPLHAHGRAAQSNSDYICKWKSDYGASCWIVSTDNAEDAEDFSCGLIHTIGAVILGIGMISCAVMVLFETLMLIFACKLDPRWNVGSIEGRTPDLAIEGPQVILTQAPGTGIPIAQATSVPIAQATAVAKPI